ncbi:hypothetical protein [Methylobacterium sp. J-068]|uniref:hypothetical protein n=1 Tax=Methylobacterium sp. J-068 TaxID=2836649 RepID=UPI001FBBF4AE|nr:hypothetical protein [Methylobacterium sp. J-068]MCJ2033625.1 hypothetical protein [Methylobacterium sp. J-068]
MLRHVLLGSAVALAASAAPVLAGGEPGPYRRGPSLPPEIAYRDPAYLAPPPRAVIVAPEFLAPRALGLPLYNEPPPRFPTP